MPRRRWQKFAGITLLVVTTLVVVGITFTIGWRPFIGAKKRALANRKFEATPQRLARGKYLVDGVMGCFGCHTDADWSKPGAPPLAGREGSGHVWSDQDRPCSSPRTSRPTRRPAPVIGATTRWPAPSAKASGTTAGRCFPSCLIRVIARCRMKISIR